MIPEIQKTQGIRFLDVTFIGPLMVIAGLLNKNKLLKTLLVVNGVATVWYNNKNYVAQEQELFNNYLKSKEKVKSII